MNGLYTVHYASQNIEEIIQAIKDNPDLKWEDTIVIITSDNGAAPTAANGYSFGSALPLRGAKSEDEIYLYRCPPSMCYGDYHVMRKRCFVMFSH